MAEIVVPKHPKSYVYPTPAVQEWIPGTHQLSVQAGKELIDQIASKGEPFAAEVLQPQHMALGDVLIRDVRGLHRGVRAETSSMVWHGLQSC